MKYALDVFKFLRELSSPLLYINIFVLMQTSFQALFSVCGCHFQPFFKKFEFCHTSQLYVCVLQDSRLRDLLLQSPHLLPVADPYSGYTALHWAAKVLTTLHCTTLHCTGLQIYSLHCTALHCTELHCTTLHWSSIFYTVLHYAVLQLDKWIYSFPFPSTTTSPWSASSWTTPSWCPWDPRWYLEYNMSHVTSH